MSRRIRRGRRGIDLPLKTPPAATDRLIGHDPNGAMFQATLAAIASAMPGNTSVVENTNGISVRFPSSRIQIAAGIGVERTISNPVGSVYYTGNHGQDFPQEFAQPPYVVPGVVTGLGGNALGARLAGISTAGVVYRLYAPNNGTVVQFTYVALGRY